MLTLHDSNPLLANEARIIWASLYLPFYINKQAYVKAMPWFLIPNEYESLRYISALS